MAPETPNEYELAGVVVHIGGSLYAGHYIAYVRSGSRWYCVGAAHQCNDSSVHPVDFRKVQNDEAYMLFYSLKKKPRTDCSHEKPPRDPTKPLNGAPPAPSDSDKKPKLDPPLKPANPRLAALLQPKPEPAVNGAQHAAPLSTADAPSKPKTDDRGRPARPQSAQPNQDLLSILFGSSEKPARPADRPEWYAAQEPGSLSKRPPEVCSQRSKQSVGPKLKRSPVPDLKHLRLMAQRAKHGQTPVQPALNRTSTLDVAAAH